MIAEPPILASAITEVLATQFKLSAIALAPADTLVADPPEQCLVGSVKLTGGLVLGYVLKLPEAFIAELTALQLGRSAISVTDESAADVVGELCNMLAGRAASTLAAGGYSSNLSTPTVVRGHRLELEIAPGAETSQSDWTCEGHLLTVAVQFNFKSR